MLNFGILVNETNWSMIELVPVIELGYSNEGIRTPLKGPFWENPEEWDNFYSACYATAGFTDVFPVYLPGSSFCRLTDITDDNLVKLVKDHTKAMRHGEYDREQACPFFGGCVLRIDGHNKYFPQCCGDLSDIQYWQKLLMGREEPFYEGHPAPMVTVTEDKVIFDFNTNEFEEDFVPPVKDKEIVLDKIDLRNAVDTVIVQLRDFAQKLIAININERLGIRDIDNLLVWGDDTNA